MPYIRTGGVRYFYSRRGSGPAIVLHHGFAGSSENWDHFTGAFAAQMDVIAIDLPGHGRSASPGLPGRYAMEQSAHDIVAIMEKLGLGPVPILGYSMGGRLALFLAFRYPGHVASLILESASPGIADAAERAQRRQSDEQLAAMIERQGIERFVEHWEELPLFASQRAIPEVKREKLRRQRLRNNARGLANSLRGLGTGNQPPLWNMLPAIAQPSLLVCGELDVKFSEIAERMAGAMPTATLVRVPRAGHNVHFERPDVFAAAVRRFLEGLN